MIVDERMTAYICSLDSGNTPLLNSIEQQAHKEFVPVIRRETQALLKVLLAAIRPERILEVGTAVGFSAILMAQYNPVSCQITTVEKYKPRILSAKENFRRAGMEDRVTLLEGDAQDILPELSGPYDLIFMDAAKGQYLHFLPQAARLLRTGGVLVSDNVLQDGDIIESRYAVTRRNRTIHARMREYLYTLTHSALWTTSVLTVGDGLTISVRQHKEGDTDDETTGIADSSEQS